MIRHLKFIIHKGKVYEIIRKKEKNKYIIEIRRCEK